MINGHGDDIYKYSNVKANFSSNVYNHFDYSGLFLYLSDKFSVVKSYPEPEPMTLESVIARKNRVGKVNVCVTNGATEAIYLIAQTFRRSKTAILTPAFSEYADACRLHEHNICSFFSLQQLPERAQLVWICNPNNPMGTVLDYNELLDCIDENKDKIFIIDQSYAPFTLKKLLSYTDAINMPNVIVLDSMTKRYAIPGLRLGYIIGNENLLRQIRLQRMPWSVNQMAIEAGEYLVSHDSDYNIDVQTLLSEKDRLTEKFTSFGCIDVWPSDTHILLCKLRMGKASFLKTYLVENHGLLIRDASNFEGLDDSFFRIAVQTPEENDLLVEAIEEFLEI